MKTKEKIYEELKKIKEKVIECILKCLWNERQIITGSVGGNTLMAFRTNKYKPSSIYKTWLKTKIFGNENALNHLKTEKDFESLHSKLCKDFKKYWEKEDLKEIEEYKIRKVIDLFFKAFVRWEGLELERRNFLLKNIHVPIDSWTLNLLREVDSNPLNIKKDARMGFANTPGIYSKCQNEIKNVCKDIPPIVFDFYAWRNISLDDIKLELKKQNK